jgi:hypothetical protein
MKKPTDEPKSKTSYWNQNSGKLSGREVKAQQRLEALTTKYQSEGLTEAEARDRARNELRDNPRSDWRAG